MSIKHLYNLRGGKSGPLRCNPAESDHSSGFWPFQWILVDSGSIPEDSVSFLWIFFNSSPIPLESTGMTGFLQESVGHQKVLFEINI